MMVDRSRASAEPRVECPHADRCGGCPLIALPYSEQLANKRARVAQAAHGYPELSGLVVLPTIGADPITGYRTRAKLIVASGARVGLYEKGGGHRVIDIPGCRVLSATLAVAAETLRAHVKHDEETGGPLSHRAGLRAVDLREVDSKDEAGSAGPRLLITFVVERSETPGLPPGARRNERLAPPRTPVRLESLREAARRLAEDVTGLIGVAVNFHDGLSPRVLGSETVKVFGGADGDDRLGGSTQVATFGAFAQAHRGQAARVHDLVATAVSTATPQDHALRVVDLYGGSGGIALALASRGSAVTLVESFEPAVQRAIAAAKEQGLPLEAFVMDAASALSQFVRQGRRFDAVVVNPPRRGLTPATRQALGKLAPALVVYVSCHPPTLTRDLAHLARLGFLGVELSPLDMIPLTGHTETLAVLRRGEPPAPTLLFEDDEVLAIAKSTHEPTTPQGEQTSSLLERVRKDPAARSAVPIHRLDIGTSGVVFFARDPSFVRAWSQALGSPSAEKVYLALVRGKSPEAGTIRLPLFERKRAIAATTHFRRVESIGVHSLLEVRPEQGRTHQIRRHLADNRHPVLGDERYGHASSNRYFEERHGLDRTFLHCARIELTHPRTGRALIVKALLAADLEAVLASIRDHSEREDVAF